MPDSSGFVCKQECVQNRNLGQAVTSCAYPSGHLAVKRNFVSEQQLINPSQCTGLRAAGIPRHKLTFTSGRYNCLVCPAFQLPGPHGFGSQTGNGR